MESFKESWLERYMQLAFMRIRRYLSKRVRRIGEQNIQSFKVVSETKNKKSTWRDWVS